MFKKIIAVGLVGVLFCILNTVALAQVATLKQTLDLRQIDTVNVPFQHNRPYPSFEKQNGITYLDLAGMWKYYKLNSPQSNNQITTTLTRRDGSTLSSLESPGYHTINYNDSSWSNRDLPICENQIGITEEERVYWFRRHFTAPSAMQGKYVKLVLLASNYITDVWVNGKYVRWHEGGYTSFSFDVTDYLNYGADNVIAVRVHNIPWDKRNTDKDIVPYKTVDFRNYGGIFRDIYLESTEPLHIVRTDIKPSLKLLSGQPIQNEGHVDVNVVLYNAGTTTQTANVTLSAYGTTVNDTNILDPKPEAIMNALNPITISGTSSGSVQVGVTNNMFQNFEPNNGTPGNYFEDIYQSSPAFETTIVHSGTRSLKITAGSGGGTVGILAANSSGYLDLSTAKSISVWVYDTQGNNTIQMRLRDADGDGGSGGDNNFLWSDASSVQNQWTKITFDLNRYPDVANLDLDRISKIELYEWNQGVYYFDDVEFTINETKVLTFSLDLYGISLWTPANPALFVLKADLNTGSELFYSQFGIRQIEVDNTNCRILLNKVPTFLAGVARHESMPNVFRKFTAAEMASLKVDFQNAKDANMNFIRTAHYANHPYAYILSDRMGIMIWEELVATWFDAAAFDLQRQTRKVTKQMWLEMIYRDYNRPSIIIWSTNNEATVGAEVEKKLFNEDLHSVADTIDGTRLVGQAIVGSNDTDSSLASDDFAGVNEYWGVFYGSTGGTPDDYYSQTKASIKRTNNAYPTKPIIVSEMGTWSYEDLTRMAEQVNCWDNTYKAFNEKPYIAGVTWWCLNDWWQSGGTAQTMGAITWDRATKKDVYFSIQADYATTWTRPVVKTLAPSDDASLSGDVTITAYAEDFRGTNVGIDTVQYKIDNGAYNNMASQGGNQYSAVWDAGTVSDGAHTITVRATDYNGEERIHLIDVTTGNNIFQNFEPNNGTPGNYFEDVYQSNPSFETSIVHSGTRSLKITTASGGGTVGILAADASRYLDLSTATSISVYVYDTQGNNTIQLRLRDLDGDGGSGGDGNYLWSSMSSVKNQWTEITWNLSLYPNVPNLNLNKIASIELYEWNQGTYYFDYVGFETTGTVNQPPTASFTYLPASPTTADTVQFTDTSTDADGTIASWSWDFGDVSTSTLQNPTHRYTTAGTYTVSLTVTDNAGAQNTTTQTLTVAAGNQAPVADAGSDQTLTDADGSGTETVTLDGSASYDPDGTIVSYEWKEGETILGTTVSITKSFAVGTHTITLTVTDNKGASGADTVVVTVNPKPGVVTEITLQVKEGYDEKNQKTLTEDGKLYYVQTDDTKRIETEAVYFTSFEFDSFNFPATALIQSAEIFVVHYEEYAYREGKLQWDAGGGTLRNPTTLISKNPIILKGESNEGTEVFDVSSVIDTPSKVNGLKFVVRNKNNINYKKTHTDYIYVKVKYTE